MTRTASLLLAAAMIIASPATAQTIDQKVQARIDCILKATPLIDGHNDIAEQLAENYKRDISGLTSGTDQRQPNPLMTDMARLHAGRVGGQFWSVYIDGTITGDAAIRETLEQIDIVKRMIAAYPNDLEQAYTAADVVRIHKAGKIASMMGVEGGRQIGGRQGRVGRNRGRRDLDLGEPGAAVMAEPAQYRVFQALAGDALEGQIGDGTGRAPQPAIKRVTGYLLELADMLAGNGAIERADNRQMLQRIDDVQQVVE